MDCTFPVFWPLTVLLHCMSHIFIRCWQGGFHSHWEQFGIHFRNQTSSHFVDDLLYLLRHSWEGNEHTVPSAYCSSVCSCLSRILNTEVMKLLLLSYCSFRDNLKVTNWQLVLARLALSASYTTSCDNSRHICLGLPAPPDASSLPLSVVDFFIVIVVFL